MLQIIRHREHTARKEYRDNGCEWVECSITDKVWEYDEYGKLKPKSKRPSFAEYRILAMFKQDPSKCLIKPGQRYVKQINKFDGRLYIFRMKKDLFDIAVKYHFFPSDY